MKIPVPSHQRGFSLVVILILLIVMSVLGLAILRSSSMQERMSANMRDRSLAMQAAESALRFAQFQVLDVGNWHNVPPGGTDPCTADGVCPTGSAAAWTAAPTITVDGVATTSDYWIEYLGTGPGYKGSCDLVPPSLDCRSPLYRIHARSQAAGRASVSLQAVVASRIPVPGA